MAGRQTLPHARAYDRCVSIKHPEGARPAAYAPMRLALTALVVLAVMALGLIAGRWQWERYEAKKSASDAYEAAQGVAAAPLEDLAAAGGLDAAQWRMATVTGVIDAASVTELRGRSVEGTPSLQYLAWLTSDDGSSVIVNLGWAPRGGSTRVDVPSGEVTVTGVVRTLERDNGHQGTRITPAQLPAPPGRAMDGYLMAREACSTEACVEGLEAVPVPEISLGPHLSYAFQWWLLTASAIPIAVWLTRRDAAHERLRARIAAGEDPASAQPAKPGALARKQRKPRLPTDEEIEDAL